MAVKSRVYDQFRFAGPTSSWNKAAYFTENKYHLGPISKTKCLIIEKYVLFSFNMSYYGKNVLI